MSVTLYIDLQVVLSSRSHFTLEQSCVTTKNVKSSTNHSGWIHGDGVHISKSAKRVSQISINDVYMQNKSKGSPSLTHTHSAFRATKISMNLYTTNATCYLIKCLHTVQLDYDLNTYL